MKKIAIILAAATLGLGSCSDSFLDLSNPSALSPSTFPKKMGDLEMFVNTCYSLVGHYELYGAELMVKGPFITDHTGDMAWQSDDSWNQLARNEIDPSNGMIQNIWYGYYRVINAANTLLEEVERFNKEGLVQTDLDRISQMRGEALFWRGWAHQQLVQLWGEGYPCNGDGNKQGVPIRLKAVNAPEGLNIARSTVNEVYAQVIKDYQEAATLLPDKWDDRADAPRPTKYAAESFIGQAYLFMGQNDEAKAALKDVIDHSGKRLLPFNDYKNMFNDHQTKFNDESILELNFKASSATGWGNQASGGECQSHCKFTAACYINAQGTSVGGGWSNVFFHDGNIKRFGSDPRLAVAALEPGTPIVSGGVSTVVGKYIDSGDSKGWTIAKYNPVSFVPNDVSYAVGINMYLMRLAEVYLLYAEACQASGDDQTAREYLNKVHRRAYSERTDHDITASGDQLRDAIREERFMELCGEGIQHWVDVCRWKTLDKEIATWYPATTVGKPHYDAKDLYYPIPKKEMEDNTEMTQSEGYK